jgi:hypothetical protein
MPQRLKADSRRLRHEHRSECSSIMIRIAKGDFPFLNPLHYIFGVDILFLAGISLLLIATWKRISGKMPNLVQARWSPRSCY